MMHKPISIKDLCLSFPNKICFEDFTTQINSYERIAIIGRNGSGKSTLLKILQQLIEPTSGDIVLDPNINFGYVPQLIEEFDSLSGAQRFNKLMTKALNIEPDLLLLDEPTNHLDHHNRKSLMRMLQSYPGTLIVVSHDTELLRSCIDTLWHIDNGQINVFSGKYDHYINEIKNQRNALEQEIVCLERKKQDMHTDLMQEQKRAAKSRSKGKKSIEQKKWPTIVSKAKANRAGQTAGNKKASINHKKQAANEKLSHLYLPDIIMPTFSLTAQNIGDRSLVHISEGSVAYPQQSPILQEINLSLSSKDRIAIVGDNGSGKSTVIKAMLNSLGVIRTGHWYIPKQEDIGYLDQHYNNLAPQISVIDSISELMPSWSHAQTRRHLNDFLFRKNEEVNALANQLSGGEKVRLSLAKISAKTPRLLILDEVTNNLDIETCDHVIQVLKNYPGAIIVISHDNDFLKAINVTDYYEIINKSIIKK